MPSSSLVASRSQDLWLLCGIDKLIGLNKTHCFSDNSTCTRAFAAFNLKEMHIFGLLPQVLTLSKLAFGHYTATTVVPALTSLDRSQVSATLPKIKSMSMLDGATAAVVNLLISSTAIGPGPIV